MEINVTGCKTCPFAIVDGGTWDTDCTHPNMEHPNLISSDVYNKSAVLTGCPLLIDITTIILTNYKQPKL